MSGLNETDLLQGEGRFQDILKGIRTRFFTFEEFPFVDRDSLPQNIISDALCLEPYEIRNYASGLNRKQLEGLILDLCETSGQAEIQAALKILEVRLSPRLIKLLITLYQYNDASQGLNEALKFSSNQIKQKGDNSAEGYFVQRFGEKTDKQGAVCKTICTGTRNLRNAG